MVVITLNFELKNYLTPKTYLLFVGTKHKQECSITSSMIEWPMNRIVCTLSTPKRALKIALKNPTKIYNWCTSISKPVIRSLFFLILVWFLQGNDIHSNLSLWQMRLFLNDIKKDNNSYIFMSTVFCLDKHSCSNTIRDRALFQVIESGRFTLYTNIKLFLWRSKCYQQLRR